MPSALDNVSRKLPVLGRAMTDALAQLSPADPSRFTFALYVIDRFITDVLSETNGAPSPRAARPVPALVRVRKKVKGMRLSQREAFRAVYESTELLFADNPTLVLRTPTIVTKVRALVGFRAGYSSVRLALRRLREAGKVQLFGARTSKSGNVSMGGNGCRWAGPEAIKS
jgi:hypothetical protein